MARHTYYEENPKADTGDRTEEADKVAVRIAKILSNTLERLALMQRMIFLLKMHGILEMHWLELTITI